MLFTVSPGGVLNGELRVPGDKSISHRAIMLGSIADGETEVEGFLQGEDSLATLQAFQKMGVRIETGDGDKLLVHGVGLHGLCMPDSDLDLGNSGTSMRLLTGLMAGQSFASRLIGDESLNNRPMNRVAFPLRDMGATIDTADDGRPPLQVTGSGVLQGIEYTLPVASAQIKSSLLLAGLYSEGQTSIIEPAPTRDHTERMLRSLGYEVNTEPLSEGVSRISLQGGGALQAAKLRVPADISSAAFFMVAASIVPGSELLLRDVGVNPTRTGIVHILREMGADIRFVNERMWGTEPVADIRVCHAQLRGIEIDERCVPLAIDEFPVIFIAALAASGETVLRGARELRVKESDRIAVMAEGIATLGGAAKATEDGMILRSSQLNGGRVNSYGDHRIAMAFAVAGLQASGPVDIDNCYNVATSFPGFAQLSANAGMDITAQT
ncbi:MAG: 3-phosphoshikimate 1-carboxyvinyltransferase [Pseudomonadota bacterium]